MKHYDLNGLDQSRQNLTRGNWVWVVVAVIVVVAGVLCYQGSSQFCQDCYAGAADHCAAQDTTVCNNSCTTGVCGSIAGNCTINCCKKKEKAEEGDVVVEGPIEEPGGDDGNH